MNIALQIVTHQTKSNVEMWDRAEKQVKVAYLEYFRKKESSERSEATVDANTDTGTHPPPHNNSTTKYPVKYLRLKGRLVTTTRIVGRLPGH